MREPEPSSWSVTLPLRPWGATIRIHLLFICVALGVVLWVATSREFASGLWVDACIVMAMLFGCVVLHELGHLLGARAVAGDSPNVVLWPLGGLDIADVPHDPAAHWWTACCGVAVNLALCLAAAGGLAIMGYLPRPNPLASPLNPRLYHFREHKLYFSTANPGEAELYYYHEAGAEPGTPPRQVKLTFNVNEDGVRYLAHPSTATVEPPNPEKGRDYWVLKPVGNAPLEPARLSRPATLLAQFFAVNWLLVCVNLLPAFPLDGARMFHAWLWRRGDYRASLATTSYVGFLIMLGVGIYAIAVNSLLPAILAAVIYLNCRGQLLALARSDEDETSSSSYEFSEGYSSLDHTEGETPPRPAPRPSLWRRWLQERAERRRLRELQRREAEETRLDLLLEKIHLHGRAALTDEELRFLHRVSHRYPHRKSENQ